MKMFYITILIILLGHTCLTAHTVALTGSLIYRFNTGETEFDWERTTTYTDLKPSTATGTTQDETYDKLDVGVGLEYFHHLFDFLLLGGGAQFNYGTCIYSNLIEARGLTGDIYANTYPVYGMLGVYLEEREYDHIYFYGIYGINYATTSNEYVTSLDNGPYFGGGVSFSAQYYYCAFNTAYTYHTFTVASEDSGYNVHHVNSYSMRYTGNFDFRVVFGIPLKF